MLDGEEQAMDPMRDWREQGYLVVRKVFDPERIARLLPIVEDVWRQSRIRDAISGDPAPPGDAAHAMFHCNHPDYHRADPSRITTMLEAAAQESVLDMPRRLFGEEPLLRSLSLWFSPDRVSSDGHWHRDTQFIYPDVEEESARFLEAHAAFGSCCQFQIALVPSDDVEYVPGSHLRWDTPAEFAIRRADGAKNWCSNDMPGAVRIPLEAGDGLMFNPRGLHRGRYHVDKPRRTFMATMTGISQPYFDHFAAQEWFLDPDYLDGLSPAARAYYDRFVAVFGDWWRQGSPFRSGQNTSKKAG
jgi:ectoine hydroxylase-related dioxygenase (phytanoyl-CoA dioxygenase family)